MSAASSSPRRPNTLGAHSLNRFVFTVPDVTPAETFYRAFGLDVRRDGYRLDLYTFGHPHCWGTVIGNGQPKRLQYLSFSAYPEDFVALAERMKASGAVAPHPLSDGQGMWTQDADGTSIQLVVGEKVTANTKSVPAVAPVPKPGAGAAPGRSRVPIVRPRRLSHVLLFATDVPKQIAFYERTLGLRLSDRSGDVIAFMHGPHACDHHLVAFAKSGNRGFHHSSWDVASIDEIGLGAEHMRDAGYKHGWGVGRHVLGSNYFYYVQDPWGSWAEYSHDIDFVPVDVEWHAADHPLEDSFYVWGPPAPDDFVVNREAA